MEHRLEPFTVGTLAAEPGTRCSGYCSIQIGAQLLELPIVVVHGKHAGPVLAVTAGIHGGEYVSMVAVRDFVLGLDPGAIRGTVVASLQSSPLAFRSRSPFINPMDGKNLNRSFPGTSDGSATEQLAYWLWSNIISRADHYVDCHGGDLPEILEGFAGIGHASAVVDAAALQLASQFDVQRAVLVNTEGSAVLTAARAGIPSVLVEVGGQGSWSPSDVAVQHEGLRRVASMIGVLDTDCETRQNLPLFETHSVRCESSGLWFPSVAPGSYVEVGSPLGVIRDPFGSVLQEARSPVHGVVIYGLASLAANSGDLIAAIAVPALPVPETGKAEERTVRIRSASGRDG